MMRITVTKRLADQLTRLVGEEYWERLADVTEHPVKWLKQTYGLTGSKIRFKVVKENEDYGEVEVVVP